MISRETFAKLPGVADAAAPTQKKSRAGRAERTQKDSNAVFDMEGFISKYGIEVIQRKPWHSHPGGEIYEIAHCLFNQDHTGGSAAFTMEDGVPGYCCKHAECQGRTIKHVFALYPPDRPGRQPGTVDAENDSEFAAVAEQLKWLDYTDYGNEQAFEIYFGDSFLYNWTTEKWLGWNKNYWEPDDLKSMDRRMLEVADARIAVAAQLSILDDEGEPLKKKAVAAARKLRNVKGRNAAMDSGRSNERFARCAKHFDQNDFLFACANGVIDLRSGKLRPGQREDMLTKATRIVFDPLATCPRWLTFLEDIFEKSKEMLDFIQRAVGYSLLGLTREEVLFILYGKGRNGKGTFLRVLLELLGDYGMNMDISSLIADKVSGKGPRNDLAAMAGRRFVATQESREGAQLDEALIKALTGGDLITARFLFKEFFTFRPTWKIWLATNHRPEIRGSDSGIWSRPKLIPFDVSFAGREDRGLKDALLEPAELSGILNWAIEGCLRYQEDGLQYPQAVMEATAQYKSDSDFIGRFVEECCVAGTVWSAAARALYQAFTKWASDTGEKSITETAFALRMKERGYAKVRGAKGVKYTGIGFVGSNSQTEQRDEY